MQKRQLPSGNWQFSEGYKDKEGKYKRITVTKPNKTRATEKEAYEELQEKIKKALNNDEENKLPSKIGFYKKEFFKMKKNEISYSTYKSYRTALNYIDDDEEISNITKITYEKKLIELKERLSPNNVKLTKTIFNIFFKFIKKYYISEFDVVLEFKLNKEEKFIEKTKIKYIETHLIQETLDSIDHETTRDFVTVQLLTGLRAGELLALTLKDIDIDSKTLQVNKTRHSNGDVTAPKTISSYRTIEIDDKVISILIKHASSAPYIFSTNLSTLGHNLRKLNLSTHMFRHTHVALLVEAGVPIKVISERLGHSKVDTTLNIYTHVTENMKLDLREKISLLCARFAHI